MTHTSMDTPPLFQLQINIALVYIVYVLFDSCLQEKKSEKGKVPNQWVLKWTQNLFKSPAIQSCMMGEGSVFASPPVDAAAD